MADGVDPAAAGLARELGPLRRALLRATRRAEGLPDLPDNQIEVLRAVAANPGLTTAAVVGLLQLARPTISNLLNAMRRDDLVELRRRDNDARVVEIYLTDRASGLLNRYDAAAAALMTEALAKLTGAQRRSIAAAMPALVRLREIFGGQ